MGARFITGMFAAAYIGDTVHYAERQRIVGRFAVVFSAAQALSATLAGVVTHFVSWRVLFHVYAALTLVTAIGMRGACTSPSSLEGALVWGGSTYMGVLASERCGVGRSRAGVLGRLVDGGLIALAMAVCAVGLAAVGQFAARKS